MDYKDYFKNCEFVKEVGMVVPDIKAAIKRHNEVFGSGPYILMENFSLDKYVYKGVESDFVISEAHGYYGDFFVEFVQQHSSSPSYYTDVNDMSKIGFNHLHLYVEDMKEAMNAAESLGYEINSYAVNNGRICLAMIDMRKDIGYMIKVYDFNTKKMHDNVRKLGQNWDGKELIHTIKV